MHNITKRLRTLLSLALLFGVLLPVGTLHAQSFSLGADIVSRYVWRGADFGESASIQPSLSYSQGGLEVGTWASYATSPAAAAANEHDLWVSYAVGPVTLGVTDYYFPNAGVGFFNFEGDGAGGHWIEPFASYTGPESFPISVTGGVFVHNDPDNSIYLSASYPFTVNGVELSLTAGGTPTASALYGTSAAGITELALAASRSVRITDSFALPLSVSYIVNPYAERSFLVFGLSF